MFTSYPVSASCCEVVNGSGTHGRISRLTLPGSWIIKNPHSWLKFYRSMKQKRHLLFPIPCSRTGRCSRVITERSEDLWAFLATVWIMNHVADYPHQDGNNVLGLSGFFIKIYTCIQLGDWGDKELKEETGTGMGRVREEKSKRCRNRGPRAKYQWLSYVLLFISLRSPLRSSYLSNYVVYVKSEDYSSRYNYNSNSQSLTNKDANSKYLNRNCQNCVVFAGLRKHSEQNVALLKI